MSERQAGEQAGHSGVAITVGELAHYIAACHLEKLL